MKSILEPTVVFSAFIAILHFAGYSIYRQQFLSLGIPYSLFEPSTTRMLYQGITLLWALDLYAFLLYLPIVLSFLLFKNNSFIRLKAKNGHFIWRILFNLKVPIYFLLIFLFFLVIQAKVNFNSEIGISCLESSDLEGEGFESCSIYYPMLKVTHSSSTDKTLFFGKSIIHGSDFSVFVECGEHFGSLIVIPKSNLQHIERNIEVTQQVINEQLNCQISRVLKK